jgi:hypothetical protein
MVVMNRLWVTVSLVVGLALAPGAPAWAQAAEYGVIVNRGTGAGKVGSATSHKFRSAQTRTASHKQKKAKG